LGGTSALESASAVVKHGDFVVCVFGNGKANSLSVWVGNSRFRAARNFGLSDVVVEIDLAVLIGAHPVGITRLGSHAHLDRTGRHDVERWAVEVGGVAYVHIPGYRLAAGAELGPGKRVIVATRRCC